MGWRCQSRIKWVKEELRELKTTGSRTAQRERGVAKWAEANDLIK